MLAMSFSLRWTRYSLQFLAWVSVGKKPRRRRGDLLCKWRVEIFRVLSVEKESHQLPVFCFLGDGLVSDA